MKTAQLTWYGVSFPRDVSADQLHAIFGSLAVVGGQPCILEVTSGPAGVLHLLGLHAQDLGGVLSQMRSVMPGVGLLPMARGRLEFDRAIEVRLTSRARALRTDDPERVARSVLSAVAQVAKDENLTLQWVLGRPLAPAAVPKSFRGGGDDPISSFISGVLGIKSGLDGDVRAALRSKRGEPGWRALGRMGVRAATVKRQQQLLHRLLGALRTAEAPGVGLLSRRIGPRSTSVASLSWRYPTRLNLSELVAVSGWPIGQTSSLSVVSAGSRPLSPSKQISKSGRVIGVASFPGRERQLALSPVDSLRHTQVLGPTGTGKSTLSVNLIGQDMAAGRGLLVIDPKADLINDVLARVPDARIDDVVVIDPTDDRPVGLNPLAPAGRSPELVADQLLAVFHGLYSANWGPRLQDILYSALLSLARFPDATLAMLPLLLSDTTFRRRVVSHSDDPIALGAFWAGYESWSDAERITATAPVLNKLRPFLMRPQLRAVVAQPQPRFDIRQVFTDRKIVLVNLAKGLLGPEVSNLLGALVLSQFWQVTLGRAAIPPVQRHPVFVYLDEFSDYLHLGTDLADALGQARGLGVGMILAHQFLHQLDPAMRSAVLANARSRVCFQLAPEDARMLANDDRGPAAEDFTSLGAYQCYLQLVAQAAVQPWCSARTLPPASTSSDPAAIRNSSAASFGVPRTVTEASLRATVFGPPTSGDDLAPRRRRSGQ